MTIKAPSQFRCGNNHEHVDEQISALEQNINETITPTMNQMAEYVDSLVTTLPSLVEQINDTQEFAAGVKDAVEILDEATAEFKNEFDALKPNVKQLGISGTFSVAGEDLKSFIGKNINHHYFENGVSITVTSDVPDATIIITDVTFSYNVLTLNCNYKLCDTLSIDSVSGIDITSNYSGLLANMIRFRNPSNCGMNLTANTQITNVTFENSVSCSIRSGNIGTLAINNGSNVALSQDCTVGAITNLWHGSLNLQPTFSGNLPATLPEGLIVFDTRTAHELDTYSRSVGGYNFPPVGQEIVVGTWYNGKPIYRQVIVGNIPGTLGTSGTITLVMTKNIDKLINITGSARNALHNYPNGYFGYTPGSNSVQYLRGYVNSDHDIVMDFSGTELMNLPCEFAFDYTKI